MIWDRCRPVPTNGRGFGRHTPTYHQHEAGEPTLAPAEPRTSREQAGAKPIPEAGLLSRQATAAVGSAFNTLTETVKKHEPTLEDVVREALRPMLKSWLDENLPRVVERMVEAEI